MGASIARVRPPPYLTGRACGVGGMNIFAPTPARSAVLLRLIRNLMRAGLHPSLALLIANEVEWQLRSSYRRAGAPYGDTYAGMARWLDLEGGWRRPPAA
jgi:hypothetical protein